MLCLGDIFVSLSLNGMPVNSVGVVKRIERHKQHHWNILFLNMDMIQLASGADSATLSWEQYSRICNERASVAL